MSSCVQSPLAILFLSEMYLDVMPQFLMLSAALVWGLSVARRLAVLTGWNIFRGVGRKKNKRAVTSKIWT